MLYIMVCTESGNNQSNNLTDDTFLFDGLMMPAWSLESNTTASTMTSCTVEDVTAATTNLSLAIPLELDHNATVNGDTSFDVLRHYLYDIMLPIVFCMGVFGNVMNLVIFTRRRIRSRMSEVEKAATTGLMSLALADLCFCIVGLVSHFLSPFETQFSTSQMAISAFYYNSSYKHALLNTFLFISTWVITVLSIERWAAATYPFLARRLVDVKRSVYINVGIYIVSIIFNIPQFLQDEFIKEKCTATCYCYAKSPGLLKRHPAIYQAYEITWAILGTFIPIILLIFCNIRFLQEIHNSRAQFKADNKAGSRRSNASTGSKTTLTRITVINAAIIGMFLLLVGPSSICGFFLSRVRNMDHATLLRLQQCMVIFNFTQTINFAVNFLLYCTMSREFRTTLVKLVCRRKACTNHEAHGSQTQDPKNLTEQNSVTAYRMNHITMDTNHVTMDTKVQGSCKSKADWL